MSTSVSFKIGADNTGALKALAELRDEFKSLRDQLKTAATDIKIKVSADAENLRNEIEAIKKKPETVDVKVKVDTSDVKKEAEKVEKSLDDIEKKAQETGKKASDGLSQIDDKLKDVEQSAIKAGHGLNPLAESIKNIHAKAVNLVAMASGAMSGALIANMILTANYVKELERAAQLTNVTTQQMQQLAYATNTVGISLEKSGDIFKDVNDKVGDFLTTGGGELKDFFEKIAPKIGVTAQQFYNLSGPDALQLYVDSLQKANVSQAEMVFYLESVANDATLLLPLLKDNGSEFKRLAEQAQKLGIILNDVSISKVKAFQASLSGVVAGLSRVLDAELAPSLTEISDRFVEFAVDNASDIRATIEQLAGVFSDLLSIVNTIFSEIGALWGNLTGAIEDGTGQQVTAMSIVVNTIKVVRVAFISLQTGIQIVMEAIKFAIQSTTNILIAAFNIWRSGVNTTAIFISGCIETLITLLKTLSESAQRALHGDFSGAVAAWDNITTKITSIFKKKADLINKEAQNLKNNLSAALTLPETDFTGIAQKGQDAINTVLLSQPEIKIVPPKKAGSGFVGAGYVAPPDDKKDKANKAKSDAAAKRALEDAKRDAEALARAEYEHEQSMLKMSIDNIQFEYDQNQRSLEDYYNLKRKYILESSWLEILELARRKLVAKDDAEKQQLDTKILEVKNNTKLDGQKLEIFRRDKATDNINKDITSILSENDYFQRYGDIQANMNPMNRPKIEEQQRQIKLATIEQLKQKLIELQSLENSGAEGITEKVQNLNLTIKELEASSLTAFESFRKDLAETAIGAAKSGLSNFFMDMVSGTKSVKDGLKDMARSFITAITQMVTQALASYAIVSFLNFVPGGTAVLAAMDASARLQKGVAVVQTGAAVAEGVNAKSNHRGGVSGIDGDDRVLTSLADIKPNEVLTVLEKGEEVLTADNPRHRNNFNMNDHLAKLMPRYHIGGVAGFEPDSSLMQMINNVDVRPTVAPNNRGGNGVNVKVINVSTEEQAAEHMASSTGERIFLNHTQNNIAKIKQMLMDD